jgi:hypothetical protein
MLAGPCPRSAPTKLTPLISSFSSPAAPGSNTYEFDGAATH